MLSQRFRTDNMASLTAFEPMLPRGRIEDEPIPVWEGKSSRVAEIGRKPTRPVSCPFVRAAESSGERNGSRVLQSNIHGSVTVFALVHGE